MKNGISRIAVQNNPLIEICHDLIVLFDINRRFHVSPHVMLNLVQHLTFLDLFGEIPDQVRDDEFGSKKLFSDKFESYFSLSINP